MKKITLQASKLWLAYVDQGTGPVVVLVHAFPLDSRMWDPQVSVLAGSYRIIAPDLPGFGGSPIFAGLTIDSVADTIAELLDHLGINERVAVGGLSMGGYVALAFARRHTQRLRALILADTKAEPDDEAGRAGRDKMIQLVVNEGVSAVVETLLPKLLAPSSAPVQGRVREMANRQPSEGIALALRALRDRPDAGPGLVHVTVPTLVIVGEHDSVTPPDKSATLAEKIPNARLVTLASAGHLSNIEQPTEFTRIVREFLDSLPPSGNSGPAV